MLSVTDTRPMVCMLVMAIICDRDRHKPDSPDKCINWLLMEKKEAEVRGPVQASCHAMFTNN